MNRKKLFFSVLMAVLLPLSLLAQSYSSDLEMVYKIKQEGLSNSQMEDLAFWFTDYAGPRLSASTGDKKAQELAKQKMEEMGFQNVRIEEAADFPRGGWDNLKTYAAMTAPYYTNFACNPVAWTGSTNGLVKSEVVLIDAQTEEDLAKYAGTLKGKIVMIATTTTLTLSYDPLASRYTDEELEELAKEPNPAAPRAATDMSAMRAQAQIRSKINEMILDEGVAVILNNSGNYNIPRSNGASYAHGDPEPIAQLNLPFEDFDRMQRLLKKEVPVEMEVEIKNNFFDSPKIYNVVGEIPGTDKKLKDEVVLLGAHLDSWHGGTGAADNASGCIVMMEALRILIDLGVQPKRTIRVALWSGEEQGLNGSRAYVNNNLMDRETKEKKEGYDKFSVYFNMDNGSGRYRGIYLQQNEMARPVFEAWLEPFADMGASTIAIRNTTGTDHLSFNEAGLPGFQFIQDRLEYGRTYHTPMDTWERLDMRDLKVNAVITASFAYNAAMLDGLFPRKPEL
jgi:hypothetical protein